MRCLWLTLADPEPRHNGQYVYSGGLIDSVAAAGSEIEVLGLRRPDSPRSNGARDEHVVWWLPGEPLDPLQSRWGSLASLLPHIAYRCRTAAMERVLHQLLERGGWDGIVFDGISVGWALGVLVTQPSVLRSVGRDPATVLPRSLAAENKDALKRQTEEAQRLGIFGAPSFVARGELFWGNDRLDDALVWASPSHCVTTR